MLRFSVLALCACGLAGCAGDGTLAEGAGGESLALEAAAEAPTPIRPILDADAALRNFRQAVERAEPVAEALCRERKAGDPGFPCDIQVMVDRRVDVQPNAFQTFDEAGRPVILFNVPFIATARNQAEIAFVLGHEMGHLMGGHLEKLLRHDSKGERAGSAQAVLFDRKRLELEADLVGAHVTRLAGYDPVLGARVLALHGGAGKAAETGAARPTHPDSAERIAAIAAASGLPETGRPVE